jgi:hypothetical protein
MRHPELADALADMICAGIDVGPQDHRLGLDAVHSSQQLLHLRALAAEVSGHRMKDHSEGRLPNVARLV